MSAASIDDHDAVASAMQVYVEAARTGIPGALPALFADDARIVGMVDGGFMALAPDAFVAWVATLGASPSAQLRIVSTDISGSVARVRIEILGWVGFRFTDFFLLSREAGAWRVTSKVFDAHERTLIGAGEADAPLAEADAIAAVVATYLDTVRAGDAARLRPIWFEHARIVGAFDGASVNRTVAQFCERVGAGGAPGVRGRLVSIDRSGPAATARIELEGWNGVQYTDLFSLFKTDGAWRVAGKVFDAHGRG